MSEERDHKHLAWKVAVCVEKELKPDDSVVIVTPKRSDGILAARKLKKAGFTSLFYLQEDCTACNSVQRASMN